MNYIIRIKVYKLWKYDTGLEQKIIDNMNEVTPKTIVESIEKELNWGAEKLRDDITCMAINIHNTELIKKK